MTDYNNGGEEGREAVPRSVVVGNDAWPMAKGSVGSPNTSNLHAIIAIHLLYSYRTYFRYLTLSSVSCKICRHDQDVLLVMLSHRSEST